VSLLREALTDVEDLLSTPEPDSTPVRRLVSAPA